MKALIDSDIFPYEMGGLKDKETGEPLSFEQCWRAVQNKIEDIIEAVGADEYCLYLSSETKPTWRYEYATILPYKGTREGKEKPLYWRKIRRALVTHYPHVIAEGIEADDAMSIEQYEDYSGGVERLLGMRDGFDKSVLNTVICSRDKDLNMVPGFHYGWACGKQKEKPLWFQDQIGGLRCFYKQLLTGDTADNILSLYGVGAKSALVSKLDGMDTEPEMFNHVMKCYEDRFGSYAYKFFEENGRLLWMQEYEEQRWQPITATVKLTQEG